MKKLLLALLLVSFTQNVNSQARASIGGPTEVCNGSQNVMYAFSASGVPGTTFSWASAFGFIGTGTSNSIFVNFNTPLPYGQISVSESLGNTVIRYGILQVNVKQTPTPGTITGTAKVGCPSSTNYVKYSIPLNTSVQKYIWTVPSGATFFGTVNIPNEIIVNYGSSAVSGDISVKAGCGTIVGNASTLAITVNQLPSEAQAFSGPSSICIGQSGQSGVIYNVPIIANATSYQWTLPSGARCTSGCTTNIIRVDYGATAVSGNITVNGVNSCGAGKAYSLAVNVNKTKPTSTGTISGSPSVCRRQNIVYSIPAIADATSYQWTLPSDVTGTSTTNSISVYYTNNARRSGNITVTPVNGCGVGDTASLPITVNALYPYPTGTISGATEVCVGQKNVIYTIPPIDYAYSYEWILPSGVTGTSNTNSIIVNYGSAAVSGNIKVKGINACGVGETASLAITVGCPSTRISLTGPGGPAPGADWGVDYFLKDAGGGIWTANNIVLPGGLFKFRLNADWITNWGAASWPSGTGFQDGPNIPGVKGTYNVTFNQNTGDYSFNQSLSIDKEVLNNKIGISPNPTHSIINLSLNEGIIIDKVTIVDITGKVVVKQTKNLSTINVELLAKGVYVLNAYAGDKKYQEKFIKE